jgi:hypothetical protein
MVVFNNQLIAWTDKGDARVTSAYDGTRTRRLTLPNGHRPRGWSVQEDKLLMVSSTDDGGALWQSADTRTWERLQTFDTTPVSVLSADDRIFVGTYHRSGGSLFGAASKAVTTSKDSDASTRSAANKDTDTREDKTTQHAAANALLSARFPASTPTQNSVTEFKALLSSKLQQVQQNFSAVDGLRQTLARPPILHSTALGTLLTQLNESPMPQQPVNVFGRRRVAHNLLARWFITTTMAINRNGVINPTSLTPPWQTSTHSSKKYFDPTVAAIVATGWLKQSDRPTLALLVERLQRNDDPSWLRADVIGALTAITGKRFGHDINKWLRWWDSLPDGASMD